MATTSRSDGRAETKGEDEPGIGDKIGLGGMASTLYTCSIVTTGTLNQRPRIKFRKQVRVHQQ